MTARPDIVNGEAPGSTSGRAISTRALSLARWLWPSEAFWLGHCAQTVSNARGRLRIVPARGYGEWLGGGLSRAQRLRAFLAVAPSPMARWWLGAKSVSQRTHPIVALCQDAKRAG
jgi:hypothetical protein